MFENLFWESYFNPHHCRAIADEFESLYQEDMKVIEYYNCLIELAQYCMAGNGDAPTLISKFMSRLRQPVADKLSSIDSIL